MASPPRVILAMTGASGAIYGRRLLERLIERQAEVHLVISEAAGQVIREELGVSLDLEKPDLDRLVPGAAKRVVYHRNREIGAAIASGSFEVRGMAIAPCSVDKAAAISAGLASNLIERAAAVALKERRRLVLVVRETPLSTVHLEALARVSAAGAVVLPASPGFYRRPKTVMDLVDFVADRALAHLGL